MKRASLLLTLLILCRSLSGQYPGTAPSPASTPSAPLPNPELLSRLLTVGPQEHRLHADDLVPVTVFAVKDFNFQERISTAGELPLPLIGKISVAGMTAHEAALAVAGALASSGMMRHAQVDVAILAQPSAVVTVSGEVQKPGTFPALGNLTLADYLAMAQGLKDTASPMVMLLRRDAPQPIAVPLSLDPQRSMYGGIRLLEGDQVLCGKVGQFYVVGAVKNPGSLQLKNTSPTTVIEAIALAGGVGYEADLRDSQIVRPTDGGRISIPLDLRRLATSPQSDTALLPDDILFIPTNRLKAAIKGGGVGMMVAVATALAYAH